MRKVISRFGVARALCILGICLIPVVTVVAAVTWPEDDPFNRDEADGCAGCHPVIEAVVQTFAGSAHANSSAGQESNQNTYCASCHSPFQADPEATYGDNEEIEPEDWEAVTCTVCHTDDMPEDPNELCEGCHTGTRHGKDFQGFGQSMFTKKLVSCVDCHMPKVPMVDSEGDPLGVEKYSHAFAPLSETPELHGPSCGIGDDNCHENKKVEWATKQIEKMIIHAKKVKEKSNEGNHGDQK